MTHDSDPTTRLTVTGPDGAVHDLPSHEAQAAIDAWTATEAESARWRDDGHAAAVRLQDRTLVADIRCPHDGRDLAALPAEQAPKCRRGADECGDDGRRVGPGPLLVECVLTAISRSWQSDELWAEGTADQEVPVSPFPLLWRGRDQDDIEIKPKATRRPPGLLGPLGASAPIDWYGDLYDAAWEALAGQPNLGTSTTIHRVLAAALPIHEARLSAAAPAVWVYLDDDGRMSAHAFPAEAQARDAAAGDYLTCQPVELPGYEPPELFWRPAEDGTYDLTADGYPTCYTLHRLPVYGAPKVAAEVVDRDAREDLPLALHATLAPHAVVTSHGGLHWHVTHPAACHALPYGESCLFDLARELRGYEQEPPQVPFFIGTPFVAHDHGDGECVRRDCPVLIRWSAAQDRAEASR